MKTLARIAFVFLAVASPASSAHAAKWIVANNGVDAPTCGTSSAPCRSISQALTNATANDTIEVGPGRYGDLNGDGDFADPGEEDAEVGAGNFCIVCVDVSVVLISRDGAALTALVGSGADAAAIRVLAPDAEIGAAKRGFSLLDADEGVRISASRIEVAGHIVANMLGSGIVIGGERAYVHDNLLVGLGGSGVFVDGSFDAGRLLNNTAIGNADHGFEARGTAWSLKGNAASANGGSGFVVETIGTAEIAGNAAVDNAAEGYDLSGSAFFSKNSAIGNPGFGARFTVPTLVMTKNNFFGNDTGPGGANCGTFNAFVAITATDASRNYWGASTGPGAEPADVACDTPGAMTTTDPFQRNETRVRIRWPAL